MRSMDCQFLADANLAEEPAGQQGDMEDLTRKRKGLSWQKIWGKDGHWRGGTNLFLKLWSLAIIRLDYAFMLI